MTVHQTRVSSLSPADKAKEEISLHESWPCLEIHRSLHWPLCNHKLQSIPSKDLFVYGNPWFSAAYTVGYLLHLRFNVYKTLSLRVWRFQNKFLKKAQSSSWGMIYSSATGHYIHHLKLSINKHNFTKKKKIKIRRVLCVKPGSNTCTSFLRLLLRSRHT